VKIDNQTIIKLIENLEINERQNIPYRGLNFEIKNHYSELKSELKPSPLIKGIIFLILAFVFSFIGVALVAILTNGNQKLVGFGIIPVLILLFLTNSISKSIIGVLFKNRINEFQELIKGVKLKSIENSLNSKNPSFIEKLAELKNGKFTKQTAELKKEDFKEDFDLEFITKDELDYLNNELNKKITTANNV